MKTKPTRRAGLASFGSWTAGSPLLALDECEVDQPKLEGEPQGRITPREEAVKVLEVETAAQRKLGAAAYSSIAGGDRRAFDRILLRPRRFVKVERLDLSSDLFGETMFAPILVSPAADQRTLDPDGEFAMVRGAAKRQATVVISSRSSEPIEKIASEPKTTLWYQVYPESDMAPVPASVKQAVKAGCKVVCVTLGTPYQPSAADGARNPAKLRADGNPSMSWAVVDQIQQAAVVRVIVKGIMSAQEAQTAVEKGVQGIIVSNHGGYLQGLASPIEVLPLIVDAVGSNVPVLVDGGFRRGPILESAGIRRADGSHHAASAVGIGRLRQRWS